MTSDNEGQEKRKLNQNKKGQLPTVRKIKAGFEGKKLFTIFLGVCVGFALWFIFDGTTDASRSGGSKKATQGMTTNEGYSIGQSQYYSFETSKKILLYTPRYASVDWGFGQGNKPFESMKCRVQNCYITVDKTMLGNNNVSAFDAVLFHLDTLDASTIGDLRMQRKPHQRFVVGTHGPPMNNKNKALKLQDFFNWTMTYRTDSDIYAPLAWVMSIDPEKVSLEDRHHIGFRHEQNVHPPPQEFYKTKRSNLVAWIMDDCGDRKATHRQDYVSFLENYINVDIYGKCGDLECPPQRGGLNCMNQLAQKYKFMLAFEETICKDHVTTKFFSALQQPTTVPIVMGGADYAHVAPPHAVIDVNDFRSAKELANYLLFLDENQDEYNAYLDWKTDWRVDHRPPLCRLCEMLNSNMPSKSYVDFANWYSDKAECKKGMDMPWMIASLADELEDNTKKDEQLVKKKEKQEEELVQELQDELHDLTLEMTESRSETNPGHFSEVTSKVNVVRSVTSMSSHQSQLESVYYNSFIDDMNEAEYEEMKHRRGRGRHHKYA